MDESSESYADGLSAQRLNEFLADMSDQGFTQLQIATKAGLTAQYLSDIKRGERPLTELVARRLGDEFDTNYKWLLGTSETKDHPKPKSSAVTDVRGIPLYEHPVEGDPFTHPKFNGTCYDLVSAASAKLGLAINPYVLRFGRNDIQGRLKKGDLLLISQASDDKAGISVVRHKGKSYLARRNSDGTWTRVAEDKPLPEDSQVTGHCVAIIWSTP